MSKELLNRWRSHIADVWQRRGRKNVAPSLEDLHTCHGCGNYAGIVHDGLCENCQQSYNQAVSHVADEDDSAATVASLSRRSVVEATVHVTVAHATDVDPCEVVNACLYNLEASLGRRDGGTILDASIEKSELLARPNAFLIYNTMPAQDEGRYWNAARTCWANEEDATIFKSQTYSVPIGGEWVTIPASALCAGGGVHVPNKNSLVLCLRDNGTYAGTCCRKCGRVGTAGAVQTDTHRMSWPDA